MALSRGWQGWPKHRWDLEEMNPAPAPSGVRGVKVMHVEEGRKKEEGR